MHVCCLLQLATGDFENKWGPAPACLSIDGDDAQFARTVQIAAGLQHTLALIAHKGRVRPFAAGASGSLSAQACTRVNTQCSTLLQVQLPH
jgi:hypothetical protein